MASLRFARQSKPEEHGSMNHGNMMSNEQIEAWREQETGSLLSDRLRRYLTPWELRFVVDIHLWETGLSDKQAGRLASIIHSVNAKLHADAAQAEAAATAEKAAAGRLKDAGSNVIRFPKQALARPKKARGHQEAQDQGQRV